MSALDKNMWEPLTEWMMAGNSWEFLFPVSVYTPWWNSTPICTTSDAVLWVSSKKPRLYPFDRSGMQVQNILIKWLLVATQRTPLKWLCQKTRDQKAGLCGSPQMSYGAKRWTAASSQRVPVRMDAPQAKVFYSSLVCPQSWKQSQAQSWPSINISWMNYSTKEWIRTKSQCTNMDIYLTLQSNHTSLRCNKDTQARLRELAELEPKWLNASLKCIDGIIWTKLPWPGASLHTWVPSTLSSYAFFFPLSLCWNFFSKNELKEILPCMDYLMIWCHCIFSVLEMLVFFKSPATSSHCPLSPRSGMTASKHALNPSICRVNQTLICAICVLRINPVQLPFANILLQFTCLCVLLSNQIVSPLRSTEAHIQWVFIGGKNEYMNEWMMSKPVSAPGALLLSLSPSQPIPINYKEI